MADNILTDQDFYKETGQINALIENLQKLQAENKKMAKSVIASAESIQKSQEKTTTNTQAERDALEANAKATEKLATEKAQLNEAYAKNEQTIKELRAEKAKLGKLNKLETKLNNTTKGSYDNLSAQYSINKLKLNALSKTQREGTKAGKKLESQTKKIYLEMDRLQKKTGKAQLSVGKYSQAWGKMGTSISGFASSLGLAGGAMAFASVIKNATEISVKFEKSLSRLSAISQGSPEEMKALSEQAKFLGSSTQFTATEIIGLDTELAKLGFSANSIENAVPGIQSLAAATGTELARSAEIAGAALNIFGLEASESTRVANVLAVSTTKSALDMEKLATALPYVGTSAKIAGKDIEWTTARLGILTDRGLEASTAGTSLRKMFAELSKKGITYNDALAKINNSTDKSKTAIELFGIKAKDAAIILAENSDEASNLESEFRNLEVTAQQMAETMIDNVAGDLTLAQSAWEGFVLSVEDGNGVISKVSRAVIQSFTDILTGLTDLNEGYATFFETIARSGILGKGFELEAEASIIAKKIKATSKEITKEQTEEEKANAEARFKAKQESEARLAKVTETRKEREIASNEKLAQRELDAKAKEVDKMAALEQKAAVQAEKEKVEKAKRIEEEKQTAYNTELEGFDNLLELRQLQFENTKSGQAEKEKFILNAEIKRFNKILELNEKFGGDLTDVQKQIIQEQITAIQGEIEAIEKPPKGESLLEKLGINIGDEQKEALATSFSYIKGQMNEWLSLSQEMADKAVENSEKQISAAQSLLDAEKEKSAQGYANNLESAQKGLALAEEVNKKALAEQAKFEKAQAKLASIQQASSLISASASIFETLAPTFPIGLPIAIGLVTAMFGAFAATKIRAKQAASQEFAEGGYEVLGGGTHASGNDTTFAVKSGKALKAERNEGHAIFNPSAVNKYGAIIPQLVEDLNKGRFEDKVVNSFAISENKEYNFNSPELKFISKSVNKLTKSKENTNFVNGIRIVKKGSQIKYIR